MSFIIERTDDDEPFEERAGEEERPERKGQREAYDIATPCHHPPRRAEGHMKCTTIRPPANAACGAPATHEVRWPDGQVSPACEDCAVYLQQLAGGHGVGHGEAPRSVTTDSTRRRSPPPE